MSTQTMIIQGLYASAIVADFDTAIEWYSKLLGRAVDDKPIPGMAQWRDLGGAGLQIWHDADRAGKGIITIVVPDLAKEQARLAGLGLNTGEVSRGAFGAVTHILDPEGNRINLAEPPAGFFDAR